MFTDSLDTGGGLFLDVEIMSKKRAKGGGGGGLNIGGQTPAYWPGLHHTGNIT